MYIDVPIVYVILFQSSIQDYPELTKLPTLAPMLLPRNQVDINFI